MNKLIRKCKRKIIGNNSSKKTYNKIIKFLEDKLNMKMDELRLALLKTKNKKKQELLAQMDYNIFTLSILEIDKFGIRALLKGLSKKKVNLKKAKFLKEDTSLLRSCQLNFFIFNKSLEIPGPIMIIEDIIIIPGSIPEIFNQPERIEKIRESFNKRSKPKSRYI